MNPLSKSLNYGMGVFETISIRNGQLEYLDAHMERLVQSVESLNLPYDVSQEIIGKQLNDYCKEHHLTEGVIKLLIGDTTPNETITHRPNPYIREHYNKGFTLSISDIRRHSSNPLWQHKTTNYWLNIMVKNLAEPNEEILFLNENSEITEGTLSNVFIVNNNIIKTPCLSCGLLPGIMRQQVLETCKQLNIEVRTGHLTTEDLLEADSIFITNSIMGIMPITKFIGLPKQVVPAVKRLMEVLNET